MRVLATDASSAALQVAGTEPRRPRPRRSGRAPRGRSSRGGGTGLPPGRGEQSAVRFGVRVCEAWTPTYATSSRRSPCGPAQDGLDCYRRLLPQAAAALGPGGALFVEVGDTQAAAVTELAQRGGLRAWRRRSRTSRARSASSARCGRVRCASGRATSTRPVWRRWRASLAAGAILGVPTDTVYGLAAAWNSPAGVRRLFAAKGRDEERPLAVLFPSVVAVRGSSSRSRPTDRPGAGEPLAGTVYVRGHHQPSSARTWWGRRTPWACACRLIRLCWSLVAGLDLPLAATSANLSGGSDAATADEVDPLLLAHCIAAVDMARSRGCGDGSRWSTSLRLRSPRPPRPPPSSICGRSAPGGRRSSCGRARCPIRRALERIATALG